MNNSISKLFAAIVLAAIAAWAITFFDSNTRLIAGIVIGVPMLIMLIVSRKQLGKYFAVMPEAKGLMTGGFYSKIRHPMYFFLDMTLLGAILIAGFWWLLIVWLAIVILQVIQSAREEKVLHAAFGGKYEEYKKGTWF